MKTFNLTPPVLLIGDAHANVENIDKIRAKHPEITNRIFGGDLFDFLTPEGNPKAGEWLEQNINDYIFLLGNHCKETYYRNLGITARQKNLIANNWHITIKIIVEEQSYIICHSKPKDLWSFINPGQYTFREFEDDFACVWDDNLTSYINFHTHRAAKHVFQETDVEIWTVGAAKDKNYAILTEKGIEFKKL